MKKLPYLHLGGNVVVHLREIIGIFDMEGTTESDDSRRFLADAEKGGRVHTISYDLPKTYIVTAQKDGTETVYISQLSAATLQRRMNRKGMD